MQGRLVLLIALSLTCGCTTSRTVSTQPGQKPPTTRPIPLKEGEPDDPLARANKLWSQGKIDEAAAELEAALAEEAGNFRARSLYARLLLEKREVRGAAAQLERAVAAGPQDALSWQLLGEVRERLGENRLAIEAYARVVELLPREAAALRSIARVKLLLGDADGAIEACEAARARVDRDAFTESLAVRAHLLLEQQDKAIEAARRFVDFAKDDPVHAPRVKELKTFLRERAPSIGPGDKATCIDYVRAAFRPRLPGAPPPEEAALSRASKVLLAWDDRAVFVTLIAPEGGPRWRGRGRGRSLAAALAGAVEAVKEARGFDPAVARRCAVRVDVQRGDFEKVTLKPSDVIPMDDGASVALGLEATPPVDPGLHGVATRADGRELFCLPGDAVTEDLGDVDAMLTFASKDAGLGPRAWESASAAIFRFETESFVSMQPGTAPVDLRRGEPVPFPDATPETCVEGALAGGEYLARVVRVDGPKSRAAQFGYLYDARRDRFLDEYNEVRHAGAALSLVEVATRCSRPDLRDVGELTGNWLLEQLKREGDKAYVVVNGKAKLGTQALTLMFLDALARDPKGPTPGDPARKGLRDELARGIVALMRQDGSFLTFAPITGLPSPVQEPNQFFPGEAALALARHAATTGDTTWRDAAGRAIDARIRDWRDLAKSDGTPPLDAWLARAIVELEPLAPSPERVAFALEIARAIVAHQKGADQGDAAFGLAQPGELFTRGMPTASLGEGLAAVAWLAREKGLPDGRKLRDAVRGAAGFVLKHQYGPQHAFYLPSLSRARGGFRTALSRARVRIDGVQHSASFLLLAERLLRE